MLKRIMGWMATGYATDATDAMQANIGAVAYKLITPL
jgi:hypothetical protein